MGLYGATHYYFADTESTRASPFLECRNFASLDSIIVHDML